jgi:hypothetical protein
MRSELKAFGEGTRLTLWTNIERRFVSMVLPVGTFASVCGSPSRRNSHRPHRWSRGDDVRWLQRLNAACAEEFGVETPSWLTNPPNR